MTPGRTGDKRVKSLPDVPTLKEQGIDVVVTNNARSCAMQRDVMRRNDDRDLVTSIVDKKLLAGC